MVGSSRKSTRGRWSERRRELALHALAERELARRLADAASPSSSSVGELASVASVLRARDVVDRAVELERLGGRQVPEELLLLPHHEHDLLQERGLARCAARSPPTRTSPRVGWSRPGEHLQRRRLARAVRPEEADALAGRDRERDAVDRADARRSVRRKSERSAAPSPGGRLWTRYCLASRAHLDGRGRHRIPHCRGERPRERLARTPSRRRSRCRTARPPVGRRAHVAEAHHHLRYAPASDHVDRRRRSPARHRRGGAPRWPAPRRRGQASARS